jgi:hypothetical protein
MFLLVYFDTDNELDCVSYRKVKTSSKTFEINQTVQIPYKTQPIDDTGREKNVDVDYDGRVLYISKGNLICISNIYYVYIVNYSNI